MDGPETHDPERARAAKEALFRKHHCCVESCGWTPNFTVIVTRDETLAAVQDVLSGAGLKIAVRSRLVQPEPPRDGPYRERQLHGWSVAEVEEVADAPHEEPPVLLPFELPPTAEPRRPAVVTHETRAAALVAVT